MIQIQRPPSIVSLKRVFSRALLVFVQALVFSTLSQAQATQVAPPDLLSSSALPLDLIESLTDDSDAAKCWHDELDGKNFDWNKDPATPVVKYQYRFRNRCQKAITCTLVIASGTKLRDPATAKGSWRPYRADRRSFTVKSGDAVTILGSLPWTNTPLRMPFVRDSDMPCWFN